MGDNGKKIIELGYNKDNMIVVIVNGIMDYNYCLCPNCNKEVVIDQKPFKAVVQLNQIQALKLSNDLKMTISEMEREQNERNRADLNKGGP